MHGNQTYCQYHRNPCYSRSCIRSWLCPMDKSKAREICLQAIIQAIGEQKKTEATENEEEP